MPDFNEQRPAMPPILRQTEPSMGNVAPALFGTKAMTLAEAPRMPAPAKSMLKKVPILGGAFTGLQTARNNPANLTPTGAMLHGVGTGVMSALTPSPISLADSVTGNNLANLQEDMVGGALKPFFGKETK